MKVLLALLAAALVSVGMAACGGSSATTASVASKPTEIDPTGKQVETGPEKVLSQADADHDNDIGAPADDTNNNSTFEFGHAASSSDARAITALVKRYYAAALAENAAKACSSLIYSTIAESAPEDYGTPPGGPIYMRGNSCDKVILGLFKHYHHVLEVAVPKLHVMAVRLAGHHGFAILSFGTMPQRRISVAREGHTWKMESLMDVELP